MDPVQDAVLTIINDGNGSLCGMDYKARCAAADTGIAQYRLAVALYSLWKQAHGGQRLTKLNQIKAASEIQDYYRNHNKEVAQCNRQDSANIG